MADDNGNHLPAPPTRHVFPEVNGKVVESVEIAVESDYFGISVRFQDKTSLTFVMEPCLFTFPVYEDWTGGESNILMEYPPVRSESLRT
jgi:hypothetical protein